MLIRIAAVGAGWQGHTHLNTLTQMEDVALVGICDADPLKAQVACDKFGSVPYSSTIEMLERVAPQAIVISTPSEARRDIVNEAAKRGIDCFIEKPPARDIKMATEISDILNEFSVINSVGFMYRYSSSVLALKSFIAGRRISLIRSCMLDGLALRPNWPRWFFDKERSGGLVFDQAIHMLDLCRFLFGEYSSVSGFQSNTIIPQSDSFTVEDTASLNLRFADGTLQTHIHSWAYPEFTCCIEVFSPEMNLCLDLGAKTLTGSIDGQNIQYNSEGEDLYVAELRAFVDAVGTRNAQLIHSTYEDAVASLGVTLAAVDALENSRVEVN